VKRGKWLDYFLGGISCSARVISSDARGLLHQCSRNGLVARSGLVGLPLRPRFE
jgi:hypothetical protein